MSLSFLGPRVWKELKKAIAKSKKPCAVAVAYVGQGGADLLKLPQRSRLVVDASEATVRSGQTSPAELLKLDSENVRIYSVPNLHAKVFVLAKSAYVGSNNVSKPSANRLFEAAIQTTDPTAVAAAREFVAGLCLYRLTPKVLNRLKKLYRPPRVPGGKNADKSWLRPALPRVQIARLGETEWTDAEQKLHDDGLPAAKRRRKHLKSYEVNEFIWTGRCRFQVGDIVVQVTKTEKGPVLVSPPGNVIHIRSQKKGNRYSSCVYLELPSYKRRQLPKVAKRLGHGANKRLQRTGIIKDPIFAHKLLNTWSTSVD